MAAADEAAMTAVHRFIARHVHGAEHNEWPEAPGHTALLVAAARRAGLHVHRSERLALFFRDHQLVGGLNSMPPETTSFLAIGICRSKEATRAVLRRARLPVPPGRSFTEHQLDTANQHAHELGWPVVVKPVGLAGGTAVCTDIRDDDAFARSWAQACRAITEARPQDRRLLVERHVDGVDVRALVVGGEVVAAASRVPAHVVGDGRSTVAELVAERAGRRERNAYLRRMPFTLDDAAVAYLGAQARGPSSVPAPGEVVTFGRPSNLHAGGDNVDVTDLLHPEVSRLAATAAGAIPGLEVAGVDLLVPAPDEPRGAVVLELNTHANIAVHHYPTIGPPRDVAEAIIAHTLRGGGTGSEVTPRRRSRRWRGGRRD